MNAWKEGWVVEWMDESQVSGWQDPDPPSGASHLGAEQLLALGNQGTVVELEGPPHFPGPSSFLKGHIWQIMWDACTPLVFSGSPSLRLTSELCVYIGASLSLSWWM